MSDQNSPKDAKAVPRQRRFGTGLSFFLNSVADAGLDLLKRRKSDDPKLIETHTYIEAECNELLSTLGEASGTAIARRVMALYQAMNPEEQLKFFQMLYERFHVDFDQVKAAAAQLVEDEDEAALEGLLAVAEPRRQELFRRLNMAPNGTQSLVEMRSSLLALLRDHPEFKAVDSDLKHLFASWFNRGFLTLKTIDWDTSAAVLEKLIEYETVHEMRGWDDLRRRLASDRRCFAFFHSAIPNDPLVFVEVALVNGLTRHIEPIIALNRKEASLDDVDTAIFYSINNCHVGLTGISFGNFLIKQVVIELAKELPQLTTYSTLSPVPEFRRWLSKTLDHDDATDLVSDEDRETLKQLEIENWHEQYEISAALEPVLTRLIGYYLVIAKRNKNPVDPVARFHLRNGALLGQINWLGDVAAERMSQSYGFMVNYVYDLPTIEQNHESYVKNHIVATSDAVARLAASSMSNKDE